MTNRKIVTHYHYPPIPRRDFDWSAHFDGQEEEGPLGFGPTMEAAISDLLMLAEEEGQ